jgi:hypothetical protein
MLEHGASTRVGAPCAGLNVRKEASMNPDKVLKTPENPRYLVAPISRSDILRDLKEAEEFAERVTRETGEDHMILVVPDNWEELNLVTRYVGVVLETDKNLSAKLGTAYPED